MVNYKIVFLLPITAGMAIIFFSGCGHAIKYKLSDKDILVSETKQKLSVVVTTFSDLRPPEERIQSERIKLHYKDVGDYTYDKKLKGKVNEEITKMIVKHLDYSRVFSKVSFTYISAEELTEDYLDTLRDAGFDAILTGDVLNFYGYYDNDASTILLPLAFIMPPFIVAINLMRSSAGVEETPYGPRVKERSLDAELLCYGFIYAGGKLGIYVESLRKRDIEWRTRLLAQLVSTSTYDVLWGDIVESYAKEHKSIPGTDAGEGKFKMAIQSLRDAVNKMVESLSESPIVNE